ncbi:MAG TPA: hypothetical protein VKD71_07555 [Gemmataceae bacterium]|nr:hypothetical protein [Gemmataceae bacterium]
MLYLVARPAPEKWNIWAWKDHADGDQVEWVDSLRNSEQWADVPWYIVVWGEPGALSFPDIMRTWSMCPDHVTLDDTRAKEFYQLARSRHPSGGEGWTTPFNGTAIFAENRLGEVWA